MTLPNRTACVQSGKTSLPGREGILDHTRLGRSTSGLTHPFWSVIKRCNLDHLCIAYTTVDMQLESLYMMPRVHQCRAPIPRRFDRPVHLPQVRSQKITPGQLLRSDVGSRQDLATGQDHHPSQRFLATPSSSPPYSIPNLPLSLSLSKQRDTRSRNLRFLLHSLEIR